MNPPPDRVESAFSQALQQPSPEARAAFLLEYCGDDEALLARVRELLASYDGVDEFLENSPVIDQTVRYKSPSLAAEFSRRRPEEVGEHIGHYKLLEQIGEGGFGVVWVAEQERPVRRRVALKIVKLGMDTKDVIARFEQERQALAIMDHPNIARVFDAGATEYGRPYFVMELVRGIKITDYCDQANLPTAERLKLFILVCHAVQHAHQKGIIHRDLKPSNILVTLHDGVAVPKVIDFGVAKATQQQRLTDLTVYTQFEQMIGTPLYMSPEQAEMSGLDIDTRSDIYSLGVLLYELLAGRTPFDPAQLMKAGYDEMRRVIREEEPQKPSTFVSTMALDIRTSSARNRQTDSAKWAGQIRGDLDWIVMKALEKDRNRRFETANEFAKDIERHLSSEPVQARPPSVSYRFRRFVKRNKVGFAAGVAVAAALVFGITASVWQAVRAEREAGRAKAALADLRASAPAFAAQAHALVAKEQFDEAMEKFDYAIKLDPESAAYLVAKADLLQSQLRLMEATAAYRQVKKLAPDDKRAELNAALCERLAKGVTVEQQKLPREGLAELLSHMTSEGRSAAELMAVARPLGEEKKLLLDYWLGRLGDLPIPFDPPLKERLSMREDGLLELDLTGTKIRDLRPFSGMPLGHLNCTNCLELEELKPLGGMPLTVLYLRNTGVSDLASLKSLASLEALVITGTKVADLTPLRGLPLKVLGASYSAISDLSPLVGMAVEDLRIDATQVDNLSPLAGMPLRRLYAGNIPAADFSSLAELPLEELILQNTKAGDLGFLRGMPLKELHMTGCPNARNFQVLSEIKTLEVLTLPQTYRNLPDPERSAIGALREHPKLRQIDADPVPGLRVGLAQSKVGFWAQWDFEAAFFDPMRKTGAEIRLTILADGTWDVSLQNQPVSDISCLQGAPISRLLLIHTKVADLSPVVGMPLKALGVQNTRVTDLRPIKNLPLTELYLDGCAPKIDVSVAAEIPTLERIMLPPDPEKLDTLHGLPNLKYISFEYDYTAARPSMSREQFWERKRNSSAEKVARGGNYSEAEQLLRERIESGKSSDERLDRLRLAAVVLAGGNREGYRVVCTNMLKRFKATKSPIEAETTAKVCLFAPDSGISEGEVAALLEIAQPMENDPSLRSWFFSSRGLQEYRAGRWSTAIEFWKKLGTQWPGLPATGAALRAMAYHQQKQTELARGELNRARKEILQQWPGSTITPGSWQDWLSAHLILQEAELLMDGHLSEETLLSQGKYTDLESLLRARIKRIGGTDNSIDWLRLGFLLLHRGDQEGYRTLCREMLAYYSASATGPQAERVIKLCLASPDSGIGPADVAALLEVQRGTVDGPLASYVLFSQGLVEYRSGHWEKAAQSLRAVNLRPYMTAPAAAVLAMIFQHQGHPDLAKQELENVREQTGPTWPGTFAWHELQLAKVLLAEAEKLIGAGTTRAENK